MKHAVLPERIVPLCGTAACKQMHDGDQSAANDEIGNDGGQQQYQETDQSRHPAWQVFSEFRHSILR